MPSAGRPPHRTPQNQLAKDEKAKKSKLKTARAKELGTGEKENLKKIVVLLSRFSPAHVRKFTSTKFSTYIILCVWVSTNPTWYSERQHPPFFSKMRTFFKNRLAWL
jgi:hypothetical protein